MPRSVNVAHFHIIDNSQACAEVETIITTCVEQNNVRHLRTVEDREIEILDWFALVPEGSIDEMKWIINWPFVV